MMPNLVKCNFRKQEPDFQCAGKIFLWQVYCTEAVTLKPLTGREKSKLAKVA